MKHSLYSATLLSILSVFLISGCANQMSKGSAKTLYTIASTLEVLRSDLGKDIQLKLDQKLLFNLEAGPDQPGEWELVQYDRRTLLLLSDHPRVVEGSWGQLFQARALGFGSVELRFTPLDEKLPVQNHSFSISITR